jgi:hypothetical protein
MIAIREKKLKIILIIIGRNKNCQFIGLTNESAEFSD